MHIHFEREKESFVGIVKKMFAFHVLDVVRYNINQLVKLHKADINSSYVFLLTVPMDQTLLICDMYANLDCYFACPQTCTVMCT